MSEDLKARALACYKPPFQYKLGYVWDSQGHMVADEGREHELESLSSTVGVRVRGWGRLGKLKDGDKIQDKIGELIAEALNEYWKENAQ